MEFSKPNPQPSTQSIDTALIGLWKSGNSKIRIDADGWYYLVAESTPYTISPDDQILSYPSTNPSSKYNRILGMGPAIVGTWEQTTTSGSDQWTEEIYFRTNGTYTGQWVLNGQFNFEFLGNYTDALTHIESEERRSLVSTSGTNITFDPLYSTTESGTYTIVPSGNRWIYHSDNGDIIYDKV